MQVFSDIIKKDKMITLSELRAWTYQIEKVFKEQLEEKDMEISALKTLLRKNEKVLASKQKFYLNELDKFKQKSKLEMNKMWKEIENI